jgi:dihydrofolate reductase
VTRSQPAWPYPSLTAIAAVGANGVIGDGQGLLWHLPEDFARFKRVTLGGILVMGRRTFQSLGRALVGRTCVVLTRDPDWRPAVPPGGDVVVATGVGQAVGVLARQPERRWWSAGGGDVYRALWDCTTHLDLTQVHTSPSGSVTFPLVTGTEWRETSREPRQEFDFVEFERVGHEARRALEALVAHAG